MCGCARRACVRVYVCTRACVHVCRTCVHAYVCVWFCVHMHTSSAFALEAHFSWVCVCTRGHVRVPMNTQKPATLPTQNWALCAHAHAPRAHARTHMHPHKHPPTHMRLQGFPMIQALMNNARNAFQLQKDTANTAVSHHAGRTLCLMEQVCV